MAKFNVTVEFDWMDEDFNLDKEVKKQIISSVGEAVKEKIFNQVESECSKILENLMCDFNDKVDDRINRMMDEFFETPRDITDQWGDVIKYGKSVKDIMKEKCNAYMTTQVDYQGKETSYGARTSRTEYMMKKILDDGMNKTIDNTIKETVEEAKKQIREQVASRLGAEVGKLINLDQIMK